MLPGVMTILFLILAFFSIHLAFAALFIHRGKLSRLWAWPHQYLKLWLSEEYRDEFKIRTLHDSKYHALQNALLLARRETAKSLVEELASKVMNVGKVFVSIPDALSKLSVAADPSIKIESAPADKSVDFGERIVALESSVHMAYLISNWQSLDP